MGWEAWLTLAVLVGTVAVLARDVLPPSATVLGSTVFLLIVGVITPQEALSGFSTPAPITVAALSNCGALIRVEVNPITVAALYVLARAIEKTGALQPIVAATLGDARGPRGALARLLLPTAAVSAFVNNTPLVAILAPQVRDWADRRGFSPSRFLMPLSFAAILGGTATVIGTSTNLVVSGLLEAAGQPPIGMFEITKVGLPVAAVGLLFVVLLAPWILPERRPARRGLDENVREFVVQMVVEPGGALDGKAVEAGGLRHLQGVYLAEIERDGEVIAPVAPTTVLRGNDRLTFVGQADLVVDLQGTRGIRSSEEAHFAGFDTARQTFFEAVVGAASPLTGKTLKESGFRGRYGGAVVAIHRAGQRVRAKLGEVRLRIGDTLLILADPGFAGRWRNRVDFLLVSRLGGSPPASTRQAWLVGLVAAAIVGLAGTDLLPILHAALIGAIALVVLRVLTPGEARNAVDLDVVILIAAAFGLAAAIQTSGLATAFAAGLVAIADEAGSVAVLLALVLGTIALTELITNNAAAALLFPVAVTTAGQMGIDPRPFAIAIAVAASASFLTPIGYQTNTMVYGPGGYRFGDYWRLGAPVTAVVLLVLAWVVPSLWGAR